MEIFWKGIEWLFIGICILFFTGVFVSFCSSIIINNWFKTKLFFERTKEKLQKEEDKDGKRNT